MSSQIINGVEVQTLDYNSSDELLFTIPGFFEPKPTIANNIQHMKQCQKVLGKRKLNVAFGEDTDCDDERYGQKISHNFFKTNIGHNIYM